MAKELKLYLETGESWDGTCQELTGPEGIDFYVQDLSQTPEDAIIGRKLFDAYDYIRALNLGIELAKKGYDKVVITSEKELTSQEVIEKTVEFLKDYTQETGIEL